MNKPTTPRPKRDPNPGYRTSKPERDTLDGKPVVWIDAVKLAELMKMGDKK